MIAAVGVIGLGATGHPIARHLMRKGHRAAAYNIRS